ncbi:TonB-dependent receptor [Sphingopyxis sp. 550A]
MQQIPVTVTAITRRSLAGAGIVDARSLTQVVPGFTGNRTASVIQPVIRGIGSGGVSVGDEPNVATYVDGVYQPDAFSNSIELVEVERVEVLRGPQGTVFGRNATGGLINVITPDPSFTPRARISSRVGWLRNSSNDYNLRAYATTGLTDNLAIDFAGMYRKTEEYIPELSTGRKLGGLDVVDLRSKFLFQPNGTTQFVLTANYTRQNSTLNATQPLNNNTAALLAPGVILPDGPWESSLSLTPRIDYERFSTSLRAKFEFEDFNIESTTAYMHNTGRQHADVDSTNISMGYIKFDLNIEAESQEIRVLSTNSEKFNWLVGVYAFHLDATIPNIDLANARGIGQPLISTILNPAVETGSLAGFAEGTLQISDKFFLTAGGRYTTEKREFQQSVNGVQLPYGRVDKTFSNFTYKVAARYQITDTTNIFANYGTGFKSGVYNVAATSPVPVEPEKIKAAEVGVKSDLSRSLRANLSLYYYDYSNLQVQARTPDGNAYVLQNAASAEVYGGELEINVIPTQGLNVRGSVAYNHGTYDKFPAAQDFIPRPTGGNIVTSNDASGKTLIRAPRYTANLGADWTTTLAGREFGASANFFYSSRVYYDFLNRFSQKPYTMTSGEIWFKAADNLKLSIWGTNLTNSKAAQQIRQGALATDILYEKPRVVGVGLEVDF